MDVMDHQVRGGCLRFRTPGTLLTGKYWATSNQSFLRCLGFLSSSQVSLSRFCPVQASSNPNSWQLGVVSGRRFSLSLSLSWWPPNLPLVPHQWRSTQWDGRGLPSSLTAKSLRKKYRRLIFTPTPTQEITSRTLPPEACPQLSCY